MRCSSSAGRCDPSGPRAGKYNEDGSINAMPANMPLATLGTFILWFGWFGFNGGSELKLSNIDEARNAVAQVFVNTNMAAASRRSGSINCFKIAFGKADITMALNGALAGLVSITAEPLSGSHAASMFIGAVGGVIVVGSITLLDKLKCDDPVGAISVHGTAGIWGLLAVLITSSDATLMGQLTGLGADFSAGLLWHLSLFGLSRNLLWASG